MTVRWGMLSTAGIGRVMARAIRGSSVAELVAVGGRDTTRTRSYAEELGIPRAYGSYEALLEDSEVEAVYLPLPNTLHPEWTIRALRAGKHVLCEKPLATTAADAVAMFDAADSAQRLCLEGFMWRHHPQTLLAQKLLAEGAIGHLALVRAALTTSVAAGDIRRTGALGGGALLDLGCYCVSAIRLFAGEPERVAGTRVEDSAPGADGCDLRLAATLTLADDVVGQFEVGLDLPRRDELELIGTDGVLRVPDPWLCRAGFLELIREGETTRVPVDPAGDLGLSSAFDNDDAYRLEMDNVSRLLSDGGAPAFGRTDAVAQATALEAVRDAARTGDWVELHDATSEGR